MHISRSDQSTLALPSQGEKQVNEVKPNGGSALRESQGRFRTLFELAPIAIYSLTTSTHADAPRGMNFLYNLNRLNVATSRARAMCILVCSPALFEPECRTPDQMQMANAFCRYLEMAETLASNGGNLR